MHTRMHMCTHMCTHAHTTCTLKQLQVAKYCLRTHQERLILMTEASIGAREAFELSKQCFLELPMCPISYIKCLRKHQHPGVWGYPR